MGEYIYIYNESNGMGHFVRVSIALFSYCNVLRDMNINEPWKFVFHLVLPA